MNRPNKVLADPDFDWLAPGGLGPQYLPRRLEIQRKTPVAWSEHQQAWLVTRHADILSGLKDQRLSNHRYHLALDHAAHTHGIDGGDLLEAVRHWIFNLDGAEHARLRTLLLKPFSKAAIDRFREPVRARFTRALDPLASRPHFDFVNELAYPFVAGALLDILGLGDLATPEQLGYMSRKIVAALAARPSKPEIEEANRVIGALTPQILAEIESRRKHPRSDLLTTFVTLSESGDRLSESEIIRLFQVLMLAAIDTTTNTLSLIIPILSQDAAVREYVREHHDRAPAVVEELQRHVGMMNMMHRLVAHDFEWHGQRLRAGEIVYFMLAAGNRDSTVFEHPNSIDFERRRNLTLMFAPGLHHCIGHFVAKMELEIALVELCTRFERVITLASPEYLPNYMTIGFRSLPVRLEASQSA